ncbi:MAG: sugar phosphate isomerase/epimerase family protein [Acidobacteriota bacterium]
MAGNKRSRREFLKSAATGAAILSLSGRIPELLAGGDRPFHLSIADWSFHKEVYAGKVDQLGLFPVVREEFGIGALELVNNMLGVPTWGYTRRLLSAAAKYDVRIPLIMVDSEGSLGAADPEVQKVAVRNHFKWVFMAEDLGCHSIRVNWRGDTAETLGDPRQGAEFVGRSVTAFQSLCEFGHKHGIHIIIENHGGASSQPELLLDLIRAVDRPNFGTLPDFGNFPPNVDRYDAIDKMMPYARALSAKCHDFDENGNETTIDYERMLSICVDKHGYRDNIGIEYEGDRLSERDGVRACQKLLERLRG